MLGRGHLSLLRKGHGSWPDRESFPSTSVTGREDMVLMDGQLERDSLLEFCPKRRPQKCFSPPKRPWDLSKTIQPRRLWDFSPPFCKERLQVNSRLNRRSQDSREAQCCSSFDGAGCTIGGTSKHLPSVHRCTLRLAENAGRNPAKRPLSSMARSHHVEQAINVRDGFWLTKCEAASATLDPNSAPNQARYLPSSRDHQTFAEAGAVIEAQRKPSQKLSAKRDFEFREIERLKAEMALLCERLAWQVSSCGKQGPRCKAGEVNPFNSEECDLLLKGIGESLKKAIISIPTASSVSEQLRDRKKDSVTEYELLRGDPQRDQEICRCRNLLWKSGINTFFQAVLWCIGFIMTVVRSNSSPPLLVPT